MGKEVICSCCEESLAPGEEAYFCTKTKCKFSLHKPCSEFPKQMKHKSDHKHKLILHSKPPSGFISSQYYACNACEEKFNAFIYHCEECYLYIHPKCAFMPETVKREDHQHPLKLYYKSPYAEDDYLSTFSCDVCEEVALRSAWVYNCSKCDFGTHFGCVNAEAAAVEKESSEEEEEEEETAASEYERNEKTGKPGKRNADKGVKPRNAAEAVNQSMTNMNALAMANIQAMDQMAKLQFQTNMAQMNARHAANMFRNW